MNDAPNDESHSPTDDNPIPQAPIPPELFQDIPEEKRKELIQYFSSFVHVEQTSGPMPPPSMLAAYSPDVQRIIVEEWSKHGPHRRNLEERVFEAAVQQERRGMWLGFILALSLIVCGTAVILAGHSAEGLALIAADAGALAIVYVFDQRSRRD